MSPDRSAKHTRRHVSQACDACKKRKTKCDGARPCLRCALAESECLFSSHDHRLLKRVSRSHAGTLAVPSPKSTRSPEAQTESSGPSRHGSGGDSEEQAQAAEEQLQEDLGETSTNAFLKRICGRLSLMGKMMPKNIVATEEDQDLGTSGTSTLLLPDRVQALDYLNCFFERINATYRYLPRDSMKQLFDRVYSDDPTVHNDPAKMALLLSVLGTGCLWTSSWHLRSFDECKAKASKLLRAAQPHLHTSAAQFPPSMTAIQAHFANCQALVAANKYNSAWMVLGTAIRLSQIIGLGKKKAAHSTPLDDFSRKGLFWATFVMDRYLSIFLGRPFAINEDDITVSLPGQTNKELEDDIGSDEVKLMPGICAHIKLLKIAGRTMSQLHHAQEVNHETKSQDQVVIDIEGQLSQWRAETPQFFHPPSEDPQVGGETVFFSIPYLLKRQRHTVRSAYYFVKMLLYRDFLLKDFMSCVSRASSPLPLLGPSFHSQQCVQAALSMANLADELRHDKTYNPVFWTTSHVTFCSIAILVVSMLLYEDNCGLELAIENAMKAHLKLSNRDRSQHHGLLKESRSLAKSFAGKTNLSPGAKIKSPAHFDPFHDLPWDNGSIINEGLPVDTTRENETDNLGTANGGHIVPGVSQQHAGVQLDLDPMASDSVIYDLDGKSPENMFNLGSTLLMDIGFDHSEFQNLLNS